MEFGSQNRLHLARTEATVLGAIQLKYRMSPTQARVAVMLADRLTNKEIALALGIKASTARRHTEAVLLRLGVNSRFKVVTRVAECLGDGREVA